MIFEIIPKGMMFEIISLGMIMVSFSENDSKYHSFENDDSIIF